MGSSGSPLASSAPTYRTRLSVLRVFRVFTLLISPLLSCSLQMGVGGVADQSPVPDAHIGRVGSQDQPRRTSRTLFLSLSCPLRSHPARGLAPALTLRQERYSFYARFRLLSRLSLQQNAQIYNVPPLFWPRRCALVLYQRLVARDFFVHVCTKYLS